jgi:hypothetical protein
MTYVASLLAVFLVFSVLHSATSEKIISSKTEETELWTTEMMKAAKPLTFGPTVAEEGETEPVDSATRKKFPWKAIGIYYFVHPDTGARLSCSAGVIHNNTLLTAGQCVSTGKGKWMLGGTFVPNGCLGSPPFGQFTVANKYTFTSFHQGGNVARAVGFVTVRPNAEGEKVGQLTGRLRFTSNIKTAKVVAAGYSGSCPVMTPSRITKYKEAMNPPMPCIKWLSEVSAYGGHNWIMNYQTKECTGCNQVIGVNVKYYASEELMCSPFFDDDVYNGYLQVIGANP